MARTSQTRQVTAHKVGIKVPDTALERVLVILSRYREASIAVVAIVLVAYFQLASNGAFLSQQELSVVLPDTGRFGLIAVAEVMLMITGEIDLSVGSTFSLAILSGFHRPDSGTITYQGKEMHFGSPRDAHAQGIETVYQDLALIDEPQCLPQHVPGAGVP